MKSLAIYKGGLKSSYDGIISVVDDFWLMESMYCNSDERNVWTTKKIVLKNKPHLVTCLGQSINFSANSCILKATDGKKDYIKGYVISGFQIVKYKKNVYHIYQPLRSGRIWHKVIF